MWSKRFPNRMLAAAAFVFCALTAQAVDVWTVTTSVRSGVETMKQYPDLITINVQKNGAPAPDNTKINVRRVSGDAQLLDPDTSKIGNDVQLKTAGGTGVAKATVFMRAQPRAMFTVDVVDDTNATLATLDAPVDLNATDFIPGTGARLDCTADKNGDRLEDDLTADCRQDDTTFTFYMGYAVNTFAAPALRGGGTNPPTTPGQAPSSQTRNVNSSDIVAGIDFSHALFRRPRGAQAAKRKPSWLGELWVYGETLHGVASTNNCSGEGDTENQPCVDSDPNTLDGIIEGANTLEAYAGVRWEPQLELFDATASRFYLKGQAGFISIVGHGNDLIDNHHFGAGIMKVHGRFTESYVEVGYGRNDLFAKPRNQGRWKVDGFIAMNTKYPEVALIRPFIQLTVDSDIGGGGDSVQSFFGLDFDLTLLKVFSVPGRP